MSDHSLGGPKIAWSNDDIEWFNSLTKRAMAASDRYEPDDVTPTRFAGYLECDIVDAIAYMNEEDPEFKGRLEAGIALHIMIHTAIWIGIQLGADYEIR